MEHREPTGWCSDWMWVAHCVRPDADEIRRPDLGALGHAVLQGARPIAIAYRHGRLDGQHRPITVTRLERVVRQDQRAIRGPFCHRQGVTDPGRDRHLDDHRQA